MGNTYTTANVSCDYCLATVDCMHSIVKVYSLGKLDGMYLCNLCLNSKSRRYLFSSVRANEKTQ
jgi:hypothetical protein